MNKRLVISGMGFFHSNGYTKENLWKQIQNSFVEPEGYSKVADEKTKSKFGYEIEGKYAPNDFIQNRNLKRLADFSKILCCASQFALEDASISKEAENYNPEEIGSIVNTVHGPMNVTFAYLTDLLTTGPSTARPIYFQQTVNNVACGQVAIQNNLKGVSSTIIGASSLLYAIDLLRKGKADAVLVAGHEELHPYIYAAYDSNGMLAKDVGKGELSIPFSPNANGIVLGEGAGVLIIETFESAKKRNAHIYAEIIDEVAVTDETFCKRFDEFECGKSTGFYRAMTQVLANSNVSPEQIGFISLAGNSCKNVDDTERDAINKIFKNSEQLGYIASKAIFGETLGASEMFAVIPSLLCMENGQVPGLRYLDDNKHSSENTDYCIVNSMFTGGNINSLLLKKYKEDKDAV